MASNLLYTFRSKSKQAQIYRSLKGTTGRRQFYDPSPASSTTRPNSGKKNEGASNSEKSPHAKWYADTVPAMIPVALLGTAVYMASPFLVSNHSVTLC